VTAIEETRAVDGAGKDIHGGKPTVDGVHPALPWPHLTYGDAVHAELVARGLGPDVMEAGLRTGTEGGRELFLRLVWLPGHPALGEAVRTDGLIVLWSPLTGWAGRAEDDDGEHVVLLDVDELAAPELLADAARHLAAHGVADAWVPPADGRWEHARALDNALAHFDERPVTW